MVTMRDKYGDLLLKTPHGWKFVDENDFEDYPPDECSPEEDEE